MHETITLTLRRERCEHAVNMPLGFAAALDGGIDRRARDAAKGARTPQVGDGFAHRDPGAEHAGQTGVEARDVSSADGPSPPSSWRRGWPR